MHAARALFVETGGAEDRATTFARDQLAALRCADERAARARIWHRDRRGLLVGRHHRIDVSSPASAGLSRRLSGGRVVPAGPGVTCITLFVPSVDWLDPKTPGLKPDQVLNRALRPLLALLREHGVDAFYGGRDLVTVERRTLAHASFTVMRDGVAAVEMHIACEPAFRALPELLDELDPAGVTGVDRTAFDSAVSLAELRAAAISDWTDAWTASAAATFGCETARSDSAHPEEPAVDVTTAAGSAAHAFLSSPGPVAPDLRTAAEVSMLGFVECAGAMRGDRLTRLEIAGDLIAPFHTLDDIAAECEGEPLRPANIRKALARALAKPRSFLLGLRDLDPLILRLAD